MRKTLLATTVVACAGALSAGPALSADMLSVGVSGFMEQWVGFVDRSDSADKSVEGGVDQWSDSEVHFRGKLETDNGLSFSVKVELEGNTAGDTIDESQLTVGGSFGQIVLGTEDHPAALMHYGNQDVGVGYCGDSGWTGVTGCSRNGGLGFGTNGWGVGGDEQKVAYYTPRMPVGEGGTVQFGLAYIPDHTAEDSNGAPNGNDHDGFSAGLNMKQALGDASVALSAGHYQVSRTMDAVALKSGMNDDAITVGTYMSNVAAIKAYADAQADGTDGSLDTLANGAATAEASNMGAFDTMASKADDQTWTNFGLQVGFGSFSFNVAYAEHDGGAYMVAKSPIPVHDGSMWDHDGDDATDMVADSADNNNPANDMARTVLVKDASQDYDLASAGVKYSDGPMALSLTHMMGDAGNGTEGNVTMLSLAYTLGPGVASKNSIISGEQGTKDGTAFVTGIAIGF